MRRSAAACTHLIALAFCACSTAHERLDTAGDGSTSGGLREDAALASSIDAADDAGLAATLCRGLDHGSLACLDAAYQVLAESYCSSPCGAPPEPDCVRIEAASYWAGGLAEYFTLGVAEVDVDAVACRIEANRECHYGEPCGALARLVRRGLGETCWSWQQCEDGLYCAREGSICPGTCETGARPGEPCNPGCLGSCQGGDTCLAVEYVNDVPVGGDCGFIEGSDPLQYASCDRDSFCIGLPHGFCDGFGREGEPCHFGCAPNLDCIDHTCQRPVVVRPQLGDPCDPEDLHSCGDWTYLDCSRRTSTCAELARHLGDPCISGVQRPCVEGSCTRDPVLDAWFCTSDDGRPGAGESCVGGTGCSGAAICCGGLCVSDELPGL